ncbi:MAG: hypothetical protein QF659_04585 [Dehalococcoidia bacterium]|jgi:uncharacterized protein YfaP (DUF2135 family)|nr:hypothetical protein [Dehalococcoidia bacterium]
MPAPLTLELLSPVDGASSEVPAVAVLGKTSADAVVEINGVPVEVAADGSFQRDMVLGDSENEIEVTVEGLSGEAEIQSAEVLYSPPADGLPFTVFYPPDGLEVSQPNLMVIGGTRADAAVAVNGSPVDVNVLGLFSTTVSLEQGANLIEVISADVQEDVRFEALVVFYLP